MNLKCICELLKCQNIWQKCIQLITGGLWKIIVISLLFCDLLVFYIANQWSCFVASLKLDDNPPGSLECLPTISARAPGLHYNDIIMGTMASQITSLRVVYSTVYSEADQRKHRSSTSLAFVWGIHRPGEFPAQMASNAENGSIWWHHDIIEHDSIDIIQG